MTVLAFDNRDDWLDARCNGVGATDAAAILGMSPWRGPLETYCEKLKIANVEPAEREAMDWGLALQPLIAQRYARETGRTVIDPGPYNIHRSNEYPWMFASLDALVDTPENGRGVLEIKTTGVFRGDDWSQDAPLLHQIQVQHQIAVTGHQWGSIAVLIGGQKFLWTDIPRDNAFIAALIERERVFWERVQERDPPPPDASDACRELLKRLYPRETPGSVIALPPEAVKWDEQRRDAQAQITVAMTAKTEAENHLIALLGEAETGLLPDGTRYTYKSQNRKGYTVEPATFRALRRMAPR